MARFHDLTVTDIRKTTRNAVVVTLAPDPQDAEAFAFVPGQYLTLRRDFDGEQLRRSYSICTAPHEGVLRVGIREVEGGAFSTWANRELAAGDVIQSMAPAGSFYRPPEDDAPHSYLGFAGGSGITPIMSILKHVLASEPESEFTLVYANRAVSSIMFREELEDLKNLYLERLTIIHILETDAQEIELFTGRLDDEKCAALCARWIDPTTADAAYICGPEPMMLSVSRTLAGRGMPEERIRFELFASAQPGRAPRRPVSTGAEAGLREAALSVTLDGTTRRLSVPKDASILDAALENGIDAPYACKAGVCSTCRCKVIEGEVEMLANHALEDYEVEKGYVLSCQSYPVTDTVAVDYDQ